MESNPIKKVWLKVRPRGQQRAQAMLEFALILPLLLLLLYGIVEFGRLIFMYSSLVTASREGARYGAASGGLTDFSYIPHYTDCEGIRDAARRSAILMTLSDEQIEIKYDRLDPDTNEFFVFASDCPPGSVRLGDRIYVNVFADFEPILPLVNMQPYTIRSVTKRTILRDIFLGEGGANIGDYDPPLVYFLAPASTIREDEGTIYVQLRLNSIGTSTITVPYTVSGTATPGEDYTILSSGDIEIPAGVPSADIPINLIADGIDEPNETIVLTLGTPTNATLGSPSVHTLTIEDVDGPPTVSFVLATDSVAEAVGIWPVAVMLTGKSGFPIEVNFSVTSGTAATEDYTVTTLTPLVIPPMSTGGNIVLLLSQDGLDEDDETVAFKINSVVNAALGIPDTHYLTILDSDPPPNVYFTLNSQTAPEGVTASVVAQLNQITTRDVQVPYTISYKGADGADYTLKPVSPSDETYLRIPAGKLEATLNFELIKEDPDVIEKDEIIVITMGRPVNDTAILVTPDEHQLTIGAVEPPVVFFMLKGSERGETTGLTNLVVQLSNVWDQTVTVPFSLDGASTATLDEDFKILTASPLVIPAGSAYGNIVVEILKDVYDEDNEKAIFLLGTPTNATLDKNNDTHTLTIVDENAYPSLQFVAAASSVEEHVGTANVLLELSSPSSKDVTVEFLLDKTSTATLGAEDDFTYVPANNILVIPAGETSAQIVVSVYDDVANDPRGETDETVIFQLFKVTNADVGTYRKHTLTIIEDELCPVNYSVEPIGSKVNVKFEYKDLDSPLELETLRIDFAGLDVAKALWEVWQNTSLTTTRIFYQPGGALTGSYVIIPDATAGYNWISTPPIEPYTKLQLIFGTTPLEDGVVTITLKFDPDCSKVLTFSP